MSLLQRTRQIAANIVTGGGQPVAMDDDQKLHALDAEIQRRREAIDSAADRRDAARSVVSDCETDLDVLEGKLAAGEATAGEVDQARQRLRFAERELDSLTRSPAAMRAALRSLSFERERLAALFRRRAFTRAVTPYCDAAARLAVVLREAADLNRELTQLADDVHGMAPQPWPGPWQEFVGEDSKLDRWLQDLEAFTASVQKEASAR